MNKKNGGTAVIDVPAPEDISRQAGTESAPVLLADKIRANPKAYDFSDIESREEWEKRTGGIVNGEEGYTEPSLSAILGDYDPPRIYRGKEFYPLALTLEELENTMMLAEKMKGVSAPIELLTFLAEIGTNVLHVRNETGELRPATVKEIKKHMTPLQINAVVTEYAGITPVTDEESGKKG